MSSRMMMWSLEDDVAQGIFKDEPSLGATKMHVVESTAMYYDIIIGRDILEESGILISFKIKQRIWHEITVPMRLMNTIQHEGYFIQDSDLIAEATARTKRILGAHYEAADIDQKHVIPKNKILRLFLKNSRNYLMEL